MTMTPPTILLIMINKRFLFGFSILSLKYFIQFIMPDEKADRIEIQLFLQAPKLL